MKLTALIFLIAVFSSCSHQDRSDQQKLSIEEAQKREVEELSDFLVTTEDGGITFSVKAKASPMVVSPITKTDYYLAKIDIGAFSPVECRFYQTDIPPASALLAATNEVLLSKQVGGKLTDQRMSFVTSGAMEGYPYMILQTAFKTEEQGKSFEGNLKTIIGTKEIGNVICIHNEVGYQKTFVRVFREIIRTFEFPKLPQIDLKYKSIMVLGLKSYPIGYTVEYVGKNKHYPNSWVEKTSLLIPGQNGGASALDDLSVELSDEKGRLAYALYKSDLDGKSSHLIHLTTKDFQKYLIEGNKNQEPIRHTLNAPNGLFSNFEISRMIRKKIFLKNEKSFSISGYAPDSNHSAPTTLTVALIERNKNKALISFSDGALTHHALVEQDGSEEALIFNMTEVKIEGKRVFKAGVYPF